MGEISPSEFGLFIGEDMRLDPVIISKENKLPQLLEYYMGKNTPNRQVHIVNNLRVELDTEEQLVELKPNDQDETELLDQAESSMQEAL